MAIYRELRVRTHYSKTPHADYAVFVADVYRNLLDNPHFPNPPVDLCVLKEMLEQYKALVRAADDRSRSVLLQRNSVRNRLDPLVRQLAHYVEAVSDNDSVIFATSGFERLPNVRASAEPLAPARILEVAHGFNSG